MRDAAYSNVVSCVWVQEVTRGADTGLCLLKVEKEVMVGTD